MCGIFGIISKKQDLTQFEIPARKALTALHHRGPDDSNLMVTSNAILGHKRLSIIDLKNGKQPMTTPDGVWIITFNGEILNYLELRKDLKKLGYDFLTFSDTEVVLAAFQKYGATCLDLFRGMFSFVIYNTKTQEVFAARDRLGMKPLYYVMLNDLFIFCSEIRPLYQTGLISFEPNFKHFNEYLIFGYIAGGETFHRHVKELNPAHYLTVNQDQPKTQRYWYHFSDDEILFQREEEMLDEVEKRIKESISLWTTADVEVASFLSGGVDSSTVSCIANETIPQLRTVTATFPHDPAADETELAEHVIRKIKGQSHLIPFKDAYMADHLEKLAKHVDDPVMTPSDYTLMGLCEGLREQSDVKVILCGEGGDELFAGYGRHKTIPESYQQSQDNEILLYAYNKVAIPRLAMFSDTTTISNSYRQLLVDNLQGLSPVNKLLELDQLTFLTTRLQSQDRIGMMYGLEVRPPLLEHTLVEYINRLPSEFKIRNGYSKWILRKIAERYIPREVAWEKVKKGLPHTTARSLYEGPMKEKFHELIHSQSKISAYYSISGIQKLLKQHNPFKSEQDNHANTLWRILFLELWLTSW